MLFAMSTLWVREHNRVCDVLVQEEPRWTDDAVYDTAKNIVIAEMMTIMMNEIISAHTQRTVYKLKPEIFHRDRLQTDDILNTPFELLLATMLTTSNLPEQFQNTSTNSTLFGDNRSVRLDNDIILYII